jgi:hypothetical protein
MIMRIKHLLKSAIVFSILIQVNCLAQEAYQFDGQKLLLSNGEITRSIRVRNDSISSVGLFLKGFEMNYLRGVSPEFQFLLNNKKLSSFSNRLPGSKRNSSSDRVVVVRV